MFGASFFTPGASSSQPPPQKIPNAPASDHTNEESIVSLFQALRNQLGQDLRSITSNEIEVISIRWTFSRVTPSYLPAMSQSFGSYRKYWIHDFASIPGRRDAIMKTKECLVLLLA